MAATGWTYAGAGAVQRRGHERRHDRGSEHGGAQTPVGAPRHRYHSDDEQHDGQHAGADDHDVEDPGGDRGQATRESGREADERVAGQPVEDQHRQCQDDGHDEAQDIGRRPVRGPRGGLDDLCRRRGHDPAAPHQQITCTAAPYQRAPPASGVGKSLPRPASAVIVSVPMTGSIGPPSGFDGFQARLDSRPLAESPYHPADPEGTAWRQGWLQAEVDSPRPGRPPVGRLGGAARPARRARSFRRGPAPWTR